MSIKDKKRIEELERQLAYYKEMYEMRTRAYIRVTESWDISREENTNLLAHNAFLRETLDNLLYRIERYSASSHMKRLLLAYLERTGLRELSTPSPKTEVKQ